MLVNGINRAFFRLGTSARQNFQTPNVYLNSHLIKNNFLSFSTWISFSPQRQISILSHSKNLYKISNLVFNKAFSTYSQRDIFKDADVENPLHLLATKSLAEQRIAIVYPLARRLGYGIEYSEGGLSVEKMQKFLQATGEEYEKQIPFYQYLLTNSHWQTLHWDNCINILLRRLGRQYEWMKNEKPQYAQLISQSFWSSNPIPIYPHELVGVKEEDKEAAIKTVIQCVQSWIEKNPSGQVIAVQEGIWDGYFLINLYFQCAKKNISSKIIGTDINSASLALFTIYAKDIMNIPDSDFFAYFNDVNTPLIYKDLSRIGIKLPKTKILNIYFRVLIDIPETNLFEAIKIKSQEMRPHDLLIITIAEETPSSKEALKEAKLEKSHSGIFFETYSRQVSNDISSKVLFLKKNLIQNFVDHLEKENDLQVVSNEAVNIKIELSRTKSTNPYQAHCLVLKK